MSLHVIVGAGPVGRALAELLAERGEQVRIVTRSGTGPDVAERVAADATDASRLTELTTGAAVLYNCAAPAYERWLSDWPPLAAAMLAAAERTGAIYAAAGNLYGYGPVDGPITPQTPLAATDPKCRLRADLWRDALALHEAGRIRATEVRSSDYLEANSIVTISLTGPIRAGKRALVPARLDVPHSWTSVVDVARTLATVAVDERGPGAAWLVPTNAARTVRELADRLAELAGAPAARVSSIPYPVLRLAGLFSPLIGELRHTYYQFARPFVLDSSSTEKTFGLAPRDLDTCLRSALAGPQS